MGASAQAACGRPEPGPETAVTVALDRGVGRWPVSFDGEAFEDVVAPKHLRKAQKRLRRAQRLL
jgi:transposase